MTAIIAIFRLCPSWAYWLLASLALLGAAEIHGHHKGAQSVQAQWDAAVIAANEAAEAERSKHQAAIDTLTAQLAVKKAVRQTITQSNIAKVEQYAPASFPPLPASFRVFHDASALGEEAGDPAGADATSVSLATTAKTIARNYAACLYDQSRLVELQTIVRFLNGE